MTSIPDNSQLPGDRQNREQQPPAGGRRHRRIWIPVIAFSTAACCWLIWSAWFQPARSARESLKAAYQAGRAGDYARAEQFAAAAIQRDPTLSEAVLLAARCAAHQDDYEQAILYLNALKGDDRKELLQASLLRADWCFRELAHFSEAEQAYREALRLDADNLPAHRGLVELLATCARSREAIPSILQIIRQDPNTELLILLLREEGTIANQELLNKARRNASEDPAPLIGLAWHAASEGDHQRALKLLQTAVSFDPEHAAAQLSLGRQWLALSRYDKLLRWYRDLPVEPVERAEFWILSGELAEHFEQPEAAIRCYWEAARISPELDRPYIRLISLLKSEGRIELAQRFAARLQDLLNVGDAQSQMLLKASQAGVDDMLNLVTAYETAGRIWEAYAWCRLAVDLNPEHERARRMSGELQRRVVSLPVQLTVDAANVALQTDLSDYPLPDLATLSTPSVPSAGDPSHAQGISFRNDASSTGLNFQYINGTEGELTRRLYEFTGGGIGVIDYDCDGRPDLAFSQGCLWPPPGRKSSRHDRLYRNIAGTQFLDVTALAGIAEHDFGQGVAVGDIDSDGFPDLLIANIGQNRLWKNNGDGTFSDVTEEAGIAGHEWSTSCLMADLDSDGDTDLYIVNYLSGDDLFERVCRHPRGGTIACLPTHFDGAVDSLWLNDGEFHFSQARETMLSVPPDGKGLGAAAWDSDRSGRLSLLVANDTTPNLFYLPAAATEGDVRFTEQGILSGIAVNADGKAEGCMGIALGDVDRNGHLDVHITNFLAESNTLYTAFAGPLFQDSTSRYGLQEPTFNTLGFGTQFLDANLDGDLELFVANGHVDDLRRYGRPYRMPPQLFHLVSDRFAEIDPQQAGAYFQQTWLGRASATLDWNGDNRDDLVVGHLDANYALLTNQSDTGNFFTLRLVGTASSRDAAGTRATLQAGGMTWSAQLIAGGSYQASSQKQITFGLGLREQIDSLAIEWPSGLKQEFSEIPSSQRFVLVEGQALLPDVPISK
jgi:tetratricopeptide (TPR) repeat protein